MFFSLFKMVSYSTHSKAFTVFVEGNIGSGKTTFLKHFEKFDNTYVAAEPVECWRNIKGHNLLELMYKDPSRWGLTFQTMVQKTMLDIHIRKCNKPLKLMERSIYSARYIFVENLYRQNIMPAPEYAVLDSWFDWISSHCDISGDLIVYLRTDPEVVYKRMKERARHEENTVSLHYLQKLHELHENWLIHNTISKTTLPPVITVDANVALESMSEKIRSVENVIFQRSHIDSKIMAEVPDILNSSGMMSKASVTNEGEKIIVT